MEQLIRLEAYFILFYFILHSPSSYIFFIFSEILYTENIHSDEMLTNVVYLSNNKLKLRYEFFLILLSPIFRLFFSSILLKHIQFLYFLDSKCTESQFETNKSI